MSKYLGLIFAVSIVMFYGCTKQEDGQINQEEGTSLTEKEEFRNVPLTETRAVCKVHGAPDGWVIIGQQSDASCPKDIPNNAWLIKQPGFSELVCKVSMIPPGYIVVAQHSNTACPPPLAFNAVQIERRH